MVINDMAVNDDTRKFVRVTQRGQATLPKEWRERLGIDAPDEVVMIAIDDSIIVKPLRSLEELAGRHGDALEEGEALAKLEKWNKEEKERERADERVHGLDAESESDV
jgi:antitoxin PrlF